MWWEKGEATGTARKLLCAGLYLRDASSHHHGHQGPKSGVIYNAAAINNQADIPVNGREPATTTSGPTPNSTTANGNGNAEISEVYIDNMLLDCEEALEKWASYYGADLYGTRMSAELVARLNDFNNDDDSLYPSPSSSSAAITAKSSACTAP